MKTIRQIKSAKVKAHDCPRCGKGFARACYGGICEFCSWLDGGKTMNAARMRLGDL